MENNQFDSGTTLSIFYWITSLSAGRDLRLRFPVRCRGNQPREDRQPNHELEIVNVKVNVSLSKYVIGDEAV